MCIYIRKYRNYYFVLFFFSFVIRCLRGCVIIPVSWIIKMDLFTLAIFHHSNIWLQNYDVLLINFTTTHFLFQIIGIWKQQTIMRNFCQLSLILFFKFDNNHHGSVNFKHIGFFLFFKSTIKMCCSAVNSLVLLLQCAFV